MSKRRNKKRILDDWQKDATRLRGPMLQFWRASGTFGGLITLEAAVRLVTDRQAFVGGSGHVCETYEGVVW